MYTFDCDLHQTQTFAAMVAGISLPFDVITLKGDLGVGKSVFARSFIQSLLGPHTDVPSPTFTLVQQYKGPHCFIWHFDLYRIDTPHHVWNLGIEEALDGGLCLIEWPERLPPLTFKHHLNIHIKNTQDAHKRSMNVTLSHDFQKRFDVIEQTFIQKL